MGGRKGERGGGTGERAGERERDVSGTKGQMRSDLSAEVKVDGKLCLFKLHLYSIVRPCHQTARINVLGKHCVMDENCCCAGTVPS